MLACLLFPRTVIPLYRRDGIGSSASNVGADAKEGGKLGCKNVRLSGWKSTPAKKPTVFMVKMFGSEEPRSYPVVFIKGPSPQRRYPLLNVTSTNLYILPTSIQYKGTRLPTT